MLRPAPLPRSLDAALRDVGHPRADVRASALRDLVRHGLSNRARVVAVLAASLRDGHADVRAAAATGLADLGAAEALPQLLVAVEDEAGLVRQMAICALGEIGDPRAAERLRRALADERPEVRFQAVIALPRLCPDEGDGVLLGALRDDDPLVRHVALRVLEERADGRSLPAEMRAAALPLLEDASPLVRVAAAILLAHAVPERASPVLAAVATRRIRTEEIEDEAAAIELCGELFVEEAIPGLVRRAFGGFFGTGDRFAWQARVALARMGHARAARDILRDLRSGNRDRRTLAVAAAGRARLLAARDLILAMQGDEERADAGTVAEALQALARPA